MKPVLQQVAQQAQQPDEGFLPGLPMSQLGEEDEQLEQDEDDSALAT